MARMHYYNPFLDPLVIAKMPAKMAAAVTADTYGTKSGGPLETPDEGHPANLISSLCTDGLHRPALDLDIAHVYVASSTPGHGHLYTDTRPLEWGEYRELLEILEHVGILETAYVNASIRRGQTLLRMPHVRKVVR